jgi:signal transduction histidine kinase
MDVVMQKGDELEKWKRNETVCRVFAFIVIGHNILLLVITLVYQYSADYFTRLSSVIFFSIVFPTTILHIVLTFTNPMRHLWTKYLWFTMLSVTSVMVTIASIIAGYVCFNSSIDKNVCMASTKPLTGNVSIYAVMGPILLSVITRNNWIFQSVAVGIMILFYIVLVDINQSFNTLIPWVTVAFILGSSIFGIAIAYHMDKADLDLIRAFREKTHAQEAAAQVEHQKVAFTSYIMHEIRNPLQNCIQVIDIRSMTPNSVEGFADDFEKIRHELITIGTIVNDSLDISRMDQTKLSIASNPIMFHDVIRNVTWVKRDTWENKGLLFVCRLDPVIDRFAVLNDENRLSQVVQNYISNAVKFTASGGTITLTTESIETDTESFLDIRTCVTDTGIGISDSDQKMLFKPYVQIHPEVHQAGRGSGLGLSICAGIITNMNGTYGVSSQEGVGSTFWFQVRFKITDLPPVSGGPGTSHTVQSSVPSDRPSLHVLVTDDNHVTTALMSKMLVQIGHRCDIATNGQQCIDMVAAAISNGTPYDILFIDNYMPVMSGDEAIKILRDRNVNIRIISITGGEESQQNSLADVTLLKPVGLTDIRRVLEQTL